MSSDYVGALITSKIASNNKYADNFDRIFGEGQKLSAFCIKKAGSQVTCSRGTYRCEELHEGDVVPSPVTEVESQAQSEMVAGEDSDVPTLTDVQPPHQMRVLAEKMALDEKIAKLDRFLEDQAASPTERIDLNEINVMQRQLIAMRQYSEILKERITLWGADFK